MSTKEDLFEDDVFVVLISKKSKDDKNKLIDQITECGGIVARAISKKVTVVVCDDVDKNAEDIKKAEELKIPIVTETFVLDSINKKERAKPLDYIVPASSSTGSSSASKKNKKESDDETSSSKKQKTVDNSVVETNSEWMGVCIASDNTYPFVVNIKERKGNDIEGTVSWPTLNNSLTKLRGSVDGDDIKWEEYEAIRGEDDVEIPMFYTGKLSGSDISGTLKDSTGDENKFKASLVKKREAKPPDLSFLQAKVQLKGVYREEYPLRLILADKTDDGLLGGTITWPSLDNNKTKFKGTIKDSDLTLEEYEVISGDQVEVPVKYDGKLSGNSISGKFAGSAAGGTFDIALKVADSK